MADDLLPFVNCILILDSDGNRIAVKYYCKTFSLEAEQKEFEKKVFQKTSSTNARVDAEIVLIDEQIGLYNFISDVYFYVFGSTNENELILSSILTAVQDTVSSLLRGQVSKKTLSENLDLLMLTMDEIIDDGLILETDSSQVTKRVTMSVDQESPFHEQTFSQALQSAKDQLVRSFR